MSNIHVLHVLNSAHGGSAISTFELIAELEKRGVKSSLVCFNNASSEQREKISKLVQKRVLFVPLYWMNKRIRSAWWKRPIIEILSLWKTWGGYRYQNKIAKIISTNSVTLVHTSTILNPEGAIAARKNRLPHVWHVRELIGPSKYFQFYNYKRFSAYILTHSNIIIANSRITKACLETYFPSERVVAIPNSVKVDNFFIKDHLKHSPKLIVAMVGNVTSRLKNHSFFISVAAALKNRADIEFRIYGALPDEADSYYSNLKDLIKKDGLETTVSFVNFKESPMEIMNEIDILFHPAENESFGRIFIEAMAAGIPVVGIDQGGSQEMIKNDVNGFLIALNIDEGKNRILSLVGDSTLRARMGFNGRKLVEEEYSIDKMTNRLLNVYQNVTC